jgi:hypothetical protein
VTTAASDRRARPDLVRVPVRQHLMPMHMLMRLLAVPRDVMRVAVTLADRASPPRRKLSLSLVSDLASAAAITRLAVFPAEDHTNADMLTAVQPQ